MRLTAFFLPLACWAASVPVDISGLRSGPITVTSSADSLIVGWPDEASRMWRAEFSLDPERPLIASIGLEGRPVVERARPLYWTDTGIRRGGWDQFFDFPPSHPQGTRRFMGSFQLREAKAHTIGARVEIDFDGLAMGVFHGGLAYTFYPGTRLIKQEAVASTSEPDVAYFYDAGLRVAAGRDRHAGGNMTTEVSYYDTAGKVLTELSHGSERIPVAVRSRTLALRTPLGSLAVFPPPHQYFFARDFTSNMGYLWHTAFRGAVSIGVRQLDDDNSPYYPWMNAPPGTVQRMPVFFLISDQPPN